MNTNVMDIAQKAVKQLEQLASSGGSNDSVKQLATEVRLGLESVASSLESLAQAVRDLNKPPPG